MLTAVIEIEGAINSRPLSYICSSDLEELLTPSHLIMGRRLLNLPDNLDCLPDPDDEDFEVNTNKLTKCMKHLASVLNHFWKRWRSKYLAELRESHCYAAKKTACASSVNWWEILLLFMMMPYHVKLRHVQELFPGYDGLLCSALVRVATRERQHTLLKWPLQRLCPLEIPNTDPSSELLPEPRPLPTSEPEPVADQNGEIPTKDGETCEDTPVMTGI